jgi:hypothetical protein
MQEQKVPKFSEKNSTRRVELINRYELFSEFLRHNLILFAPLFNSGIDFILRRESDGLILNVQQKANMTVAEKYYGRDIWMLFGDRYKKRRSTWYLVPHDYLTGLIRPLYGHTEGSWKREKNPGYSISVPAKLNEELKPFALPFVFETLTPEFLTKYAIKPAESW